MATWEDGPEYAPIERPTEFDVPDVAPLEVAPPAQRPAANAPVDRPRFDGPGAPVAPLATLVPNQPEDARDPSVPFDVATSTITSTEGSAWGAAHWAGPNAWGPPAGAGFGPAPMPGAPTASTTPALGGWPAPGAAAPTGAAPPLPTQGPATWPAPTDPMVINSGPATNPGGYAAPGTTQWFGYTPPVGAPVATNAEPTPGDVVKAMTPGVLVTLLITVVYPLAPICFVIAFVLASRIRVARQGVIRTFTVTAVSIFVLTVIVFALSQDPDASFYSTLSVLSLLGSLVALVVIAVQVRSALKKGAGPTPPSPGYPPYSGSPWG